MINSPKPTHQETRIGTAFFLLWLFVLPGLAELLNSFLPKPLSSGQLNFAFYSVSFLGTVLIFRVYLRDSVRELRSKLLPALVWTGVGFLGNLAAGQLLGALFAALIPDFANYNDQTVAQSLLDAPVLMTVGVVLLVPVTEETLFRGLLFRGLYDRSPAAAWLASILAFALIHVMGYIGTAAPAVLLMNFLQYIPAGLCLCFAYRFGGSVLSPMLLHATINAAAILSMR